MVNYLCRLCSSKEKIIDVYHAQLESGEQLRQYILLASGIEIQKNDPISRMVCHRCCEIAVKLHKYRCNAIANDKLLKEKCGQPYTPPITDKDELLSAASKIYNINEDNIHKGEGDPLDILNNYVTTEAKDLTNPPLNKPNEQACLNNNKVVSQAQTLLSSVPKGDTPRSSPNTPVTNQKSRIGNKTLNKTHTKLTNGRHVTADTQLHVVGDEAKLSTPHNKNSTLLSKAAISKNNKINNTSERSNGALPSALKCDIIKSIITHTTLISNNQSKSTEASTPPKIYNTNEASLPLSHIAKHPTVKKLLKEYNSLQLPEEVYACNISPNVSLNPTEVKDWYALQQYNLKDKLHDKPNENVIPLDETEQPRLRKRNRTRIIISSGSEDEDDEWLPSKVSSLDGVFNKTANKSNTAIIHNSNQNIASSDYMYATQATIASSSYPAILPAYTDNVIQQSANNGIQVLIGYAVPSQALQAVTNTTEKVNFGDSNSTVLKTLLQSSNCQTTANLLTDFSKYGINVESAEPPMRFDSATDVSTTNLLTDMVLDAIIEKTPENAITANNKEEIICISDDDDDIVDIKEAQNDSSEANSFTNLGEEKTIEYLLQKHISSKQVRKESQTFNPLNSVVHRTKTNLIALPNMLGELRRYKVPIELEYSQVNNARFVENVNLPIPCVKDLWLSEDCKDIQEISRKIPRTSNTTNTTNKNYSTSMGVANNADSNKLCSPIHILQRLNEIDNTKASAHKTKALKQIPNLEAINNGIQTTLHNSAAASHQNIMVTTATFSPPSSSGNNSTPIILNGQPSTPIILNGHPLMLSSMLVSSKPSETAKPVTPNTGMNSTVQDYFRIPTDPTNQTILSNTLPARTITTTEPVGTVSPPLPDRLVIASVCSESNVEPNDVLLPATINNNLRSILGPSLHQNPQETNNTEVPRSKIRVKNISELIG